MAITKEEIEHIATLARLELGDEERDSFREQLSDILEYVGKLSEVDIEGVEPMSHSIAVHNVFRDDEEHACPIETRAAVIGSFPDEEDDHLKVRAIFS